MKGYVYYDFDGNLVIKDYKYISETNPLFWSYNSHLVVKKWMFDTDEPSIMRSIMVDFRNMELKRSLVLEFLNSINFDLATLRLPSDENTVQPRS